MSYSERRRRKELKRSRQAAEAPVVPCPVCHTAIIMSGVPHCPKCGWALPVIDLPRIGQ